MQIGNMTYNGPDDIPSEIPIFPLKAVLLLPRGQLPLNIFEPRYVDMVDSSLRGFRVIGIIQPNQNDKEGEDEDNPKLFSVGCVGRITTFQETGDGRYLLTLTGITRFRLQEEVFSDNKFRMAKVSANEYKSDFEPDDGIEKINREFLLSTLKKFLDANQLEADWEGVASVSTETLVNGLSMMCPFGTQEKQALLETPTLVERAETLIAITEMELAKSVSNDDITIQ